MKTVWVKHLVRVTAVILSTTFTLVGCDNSQKFTSLRSPSASQSADENLECIDNETPKVEGNLTAVAGSPITLTYRIEQNPLWIIWLPEGEQTFIGETITVTIDQPGEYRGVAWGNNNCNHRRQQSFTLVVLPAMGMPNLVINNNAAATRSNSVQLNLTAENAHEMYITNDPTCSTGGTWEPYTTAKTWILPSERWDPLESTCRHASLSIL